MKRRGRYMLIGIALVSLVTVALPPSAFAQNNSLIGTWRLNLDKSKFSPGRAPRSLTLTYEQDGQNIKLTPQGIDPQGSPLGGTLLHIYDGQPHQSTGDSDYDASAYTRVDAGTFIFSRLKAGKLIATGSGAVSQDGKTLTITTTGTGVSGGGASSGVLVLEKQ